jgi:hypothetical protein
VFGGFFGEQRAQVLDALDRNLRGSKFINLMFSSEFNNKTFVSIQPQVSKRKGRGKMTRRTAHLQRGTEPTVIGVGSTQMQLLKFIYLLLYAKCHQNL